MHVLKWPENREKIAFSSHVTYYNNLTIKLILLFIFSQTVIQAHSPPDFRCSHVPPVPEQVTYVWLNDSSFSAPEVSSDPTNIDDENNEFYRISSRSVGSKNTKTKRHISDNRRDSPSVTESSALGSLWNAIKKFGQSSTSSGRNDLVPMKIQVYYDSSVHALEKQKFELITETVIPTVVKFFENVLSIRRDFTIDKFRIARRCPNNTIYYAKDVVGSLRPYCMDRCEDYAICGEMTVPKFHLSACSYCNSTAKRCQTNHATEGRGVANAQLLLYVSAKQTARCRKDQTIAYAAHCAQDAKTDRPVAGHANLCPSSISTDAKDLRALIATVKHELTHVLGFSVSLFAYYRDELGQPLTERDSSSGPITVDPKTGYAKWSDKIIKKFVRTDWVTGEGKVDREVNLIVTPTVVREVRAHFNCSALEGAELEDQGSDGTSMTHWEKRLFENEAMTGTHTQNSVYSRLTLAALQDTGWYVANFSRAEKLEWGKDLGCDFAKKSCKSWIDERRAMGMSIRPFCDRVKGDLLQIACTEDRTSKAVCNMKQYKDPLPLAYQNFAQLDGVSGEILANYGGSVDLADYCPFIQEFTWQAQNVTTRGSRCDIGSNSLESERNAALEYYGSQTKCFEHGRRWEQRSCIYKRHWHHYGAGCYKYTCTNGHINVLIGNHTYPCYYPNQVIHIEQIVDQWLYNGSIICPECDKICSAQKCKYFDKRLIDKILSLNHDSTMNNDIGDDEVLGAFIDQTMSSNDISDDNYNFKTVTKQKSNDLKANKSSESNNKFKERLKLKEHLLQILAQHKNPPKHWLQCSSAVGGIMTVYSTLLIIIFGLVIPIVTSL